MYEYVRTRVSFSIIIIIKSSQLASATTSYNRQTASLVMFCAICTTLLHNACAVLSLQEVIHKYVNKYIDHNGK